MASDAWLWRRHGCSGDRRGQQGQDVKIVSFTSRSLADLVLIVMPNSPLKTAADLKGKKFGISNPKSLGEMMGVLVMEKAGLKQGDVQMTALGSSAAR